MNFYQEIFGKFEEVGLQYIIVGGVAVNLYGYARFTGDLDILLALDEGNLEKMDSLMEQLGYVQRLPVSVKELGDKEKLQKFIDEKGMTAYTFISSTRPQMDIDILAGKSMDFGRFDADKNTIEVWDLKLPVVSMDDLIGMKREAGRSKDLEDLEQLLKLKDL